MKIERMFLNLREVADMLGITPAALRERLRRGTGPPAVRTGRSIVFKRTELEEWMDGLEHIQPRDRQERVRHN
jgi:excisionase family DNA binding protein